MKKLLLRRKVENQISPLPVEEEDNGLLTLDPEPEILQTLLAKPGLYRGEVINKEDEGKAEIFKLSLIKGQGGEENLSEIEKEYIDMCYRLTLLELSIIRQAVEVGAVRVDKRSKKISSHSGIERILLPIIGQKRLLLDSLQKIKNTKGFKPPDMNTVKDMIESLSPEQLTRQLDEFDAILGRFQKPAEA